MGKGKESLFTASGLQMAATPIYGKNIKNLLLQNQKANNLICSVGDMGQIKFEK